jgi:hypothetical protein
MLFLQHVSNWFQRVKNTNKLKSYSRSDALNVAHFIYDDLS